MKRLTALLTQTWSVIDDRTGLSEMVGPLLNHVVPPGAKWSYVFGSATLFVFILQVVTGTALATIYIPSTQDAYKSIQFITNEATFIKVTCDETW